MALTTSKRALIFSLSYLPLVGGAEVAIKEITDRINDIDFDMITLRFDKAHPKFEKIGNINVYRIGGGLGYLSKIFFVPQAALFAVRRQYDFYWAMMTYMLFPVAMARIIGDRTNYVLTLQDGDPFTRVFNRWFILPFRFLLSYGFKHAVRVQAISHFLAKWSGRSDAVVVPNGVDIGRFLNPKSRILNPNDVTLITTSRLVPKNGVGDIVEAMKFLPSAIKLKVIGSGVLESNLKLKIKNCKLEDRVEMLGDIKHDDIPKHLHSADIFIRPSLSEGQGISFIEAMAVGLPVIATPVGGISDFLIDGETGLFCNVNDPKSIAEQVNKLISDKLLRDRIIENARKMVREKYDWDLIAREMKGKVFNV